MSVQSKGLYAFGHFRFDGGERLLLCDGRRVPLTPRVAETLLVLVEKAGHLVEKEELMRRVWPDAFVEEGNLSKNVYTLRKLLGQEDSGGEYIETLPKRGYRFVAQVMEIGRGPDGVPGYDQPQTRIEEAQPLEGKAGREPSCETQPNLLAAPPEPPLSPQLEAAGIDRAGSALIERSSLPSPEASRGTIGLPPPPGGKVAGRWRHGKGPALAWTIAAIAIGISTGTYVYTRSRSIPSLTDRDTVVLADFANATGDSVFDGTLRQGLSAQLEQSPFLNLLSDQRIAQTLLLMTQGKDTRLSPDLAREVCQRTASAATIEGSIGSLGSQYVLGLKAVDCRNGDILVTEQVTANGKEQVLKALGEAATKLRKKLGESLTSVEKYDVTPEKVTTPSLEALKAYSLGWRAWNVNGDVAGALPFFQEAIRLDPGFAMAHALMGRGYSNLGETARGAESIRKAYELRGRVSERERFYIDSAYHFFVSGDLKAARKIDELWVQTYPRDLLPLSQLDTIYLILGEYDKALDRAREGLRQDPGSGISYVTMVIADLALYHIEEARAVALEAQAHKLDSPFLHINLYLADFFQHDDAGMQREAAVLAGKPGYEDIVLCYESDTAAYAGQYLKARELTRRAAESAKRADEEEEALNYEAEAAVREALVGNEDLALRQAGRAAALSNGRDVEAISAIALGLAGDSPRAIRLVDDLDKRFPKDTIVHAVYLPTIRAATILGGASASREAGRAVQILAVAAPYEQGDPSETLDFALYPAYLRGEAYLAAQLGPAAAAEFQKIIEHPGVVLNEPIGALARLGLGRAYALEARGSTGPVHGRPLPGEGPSRPGGAILDPDAHAKARIAYQDFLSLWKDADPDLPILKKAKAEYARLQ